MANKDNVKGQITINCEDIILDAFRALADKEDMSMSKFGRSLILKELQARELLPADTLLRLAYG